MSPTSLIDLPDETLLDIIAYHRNKKPIALACKRLNSICNHWFFRTYHLRLRVKPSGYSEKYVQRILPLDTNETLYKWNSDAVRARLSHLREKAPHVRELIVYNAGEQDTHLFPKDIIPDLVRTLDACTGVTTVRFKVETLGILPVCFWDWFAAVEVSKVYLGHLSAPHPRGQLKRIDSITLYEGCLYDKARPFLEFIDPTEIRLNYVEYAPPISMTRISLFKPLASHFRRLTALRIQLDYGRGWECALFDFAGVPQASVSMMFHLVASEVDIPVRKYHYLSLPVAIMRRIMGAWDLTRTRTGDMARFQARPPNVVRGGSQWIRHLPAQLENRGHFSPVRAAHSEYRLGPQWRGPYGARGGGRGRDNAEGISSESRGGGEDEDAWELEPALNVEV